MPTKHGANAIAAKKAILNIAARSFMLQGYTNTKIQSIVDELKVSTGSLNHIFKTKEDLLCGLVPFMFEQVLSYVKDIAQDKTDDKIMLYAIEMALLLYITELNANIRDMYLAAYSLPKPSDEILKIYTDKCETLFAEYLPSYTKKDFYKLEIARNGVMRGFITVPCNMWFTMKHKTEACIESSLRLYDIPKTKICETVEFINQLDFNEYAEQAIKSAFEFLDENK